MVVPILIMAGVAAVAIAPLILFIELFEWLTSSEWPGLTLADGLSLFGIEHAAAESESQRFADLMLAAPLTIALFVTGVYMLLAGASLGSWERERQLYEELKERSLFAWLTLWGASDVSYVTAFRLLFLDAILWILLWLGVAALAGELILLATGGETLWVGLAGALVLAAALATRRAVQRKLTTG